MIQKKQQMFAQVLCFEMYIHLYNKADLSAGWNEMPFSELSLNESLKNEFEKR